ncbi:MAG TPA: POTRA domain-containing protein [Opitutaceae bacterium]|nr:POTRA domain-containing protein [Opitutaceae bacterium]
MAAPKAAPPAPATADANNLEQPPPAAPPEATAAAPGSQSLYIAEYAVKGVHHLTELEVDEAVYPFLGPERTAADVEQARAALEKAYRDKGYQTVVVDIPRQEVKAGVVQLQVTEETVGRLRVRGARYFSPARIKAGAPALAEGTLINFNDVQGNIVALNQLSDRQVTPALLPGKAPGTVDVDLDVKDHFPVHGNLELNNRYSANTTALRLNGSLSDSNLWDAGHVAGFSFQVSPEDINQVKVFSAYYLVHVPSVEGMSLMVQGTKQDSNVSTLGGAAVAGRGETFGPRALFNLPSGKNFYQSVTLGFDYKHFDQQISVGSTTTVTPITYYPFSAAYSATLLGTGQSTEFNATLNWHVRGLGSSTSTFDFKRFRADGGFVYFRGDLSHTHDLPAGFQVFGKVQGQIADRPLVDNEEFSGGGLDTVRGYLEAEQIGDNAFFGSLELRSPSILSWFGQSKSGEWRFYAFGDGGWLTLNDSLPEQTSRFGLASFGGGSRLRLFDHFGGSVDAALPLATQTETKAHDWRLTFRAEADY